MNKIEEILLKGLRKVYQKSFKPKQELSPCEMNPDNASEMIYQMLANDEPCMIARFGSTELSCLTNYLDIINKSNSVWKYITGKTEQWWWNKNIAHQMQRWSGFFPPTEEYLTKFCELMLSDMQQLDLLGSWLPQECLFKDKFENAQRVKLYYLEPYWSSTPWSRILEGKKVLVVHPFKDTIQTQYEKREHLFENKQVLPTFKSLHVVKAVQSVSGDNSEFSNWFNALEWMEQEMDKIDYEIALIGCGAYGFPLAAHAKRTGHKAVHLGGALQLLFGIKGKRWELPDLLSKQNYKPSDFYLKLIDNPYWVRASKKETPRKAQDVEGATYW